jgi:hypothetical protein
MGAAKVAMISTVARLDALPRIGGYRSIVPILHDLDADGCRSLIRQLAERSAQNGNSVKLTPAVAELYRKELDRITTDCSCRTDDYYSSENDMYVKDLAIASGRMFPAGMHVFHASGFPRRDAIRAGVRILGRFLGSGGFVPFYEIHTHEPCSLPEFNENGLIQCYRRLAEMMLIEKDIRGVIGSSWFFDPEIATVSPRLAYLRRIPMENNAMSVRIGSDEHSIGLATKTSETRRKLYTEGHYMPTSYAIIWFRKDLLAWSSRGGKKLSTQSTERLG